MRVGGGVLVRYPVRASMFVGKGAKAKARRIAQVAVSFGLLHQWYVTLYQQFVCVCLCVCVRARARVCVCVLSPLVCVMHACG